MQRRNFIQLLSLLPVMAPAMAMAKFSISGYNKLLIQGSPLAGFAYYRGEDLRQHLQINDPLHLAREPDNPYDHRAVAVYWRNHKLGFVPRLENTAISQMLDRGIPMRAQITRLNVSDDPWDRICFSVYATV
jgi:hypothetical protein